MRVLRSGFAVMTTLVAGSVLATLSCDADGNWSGTISDDACVSAHMFDEHAPMHTERECTELCIRTGAKYVLVAPDQVYRIENQSHPGLAAHAGQPVRVSGRIRNGAVTIATIDAP